MFFIDLIKKCQRNHLMTKQFVEIVKCCMNNTSDNVYLNLLVW